MLGATGSIGRSTLDLISRHPDRYRASILASGSRVDALVALCVTHRPDHAVIADEAAFGALKAALASAGLPTRAHAGDDALCGLVAGDGCDTVVGAIVGAAGLRSTLAAAGAGKRLLLANKESVVMAGDLLRQAVQASGSELLPVDSEHNALFQCLPHPAAAPASSVRRLILTASGGPFRGRPREALARVTPAEACQHPNWSMGRKISVDSATLMNKGLEVIEAGWLFDVEVDRIEVVVHPQSIVHSLVDYVDGSMLAQLGNPDMRTAIAYGLAWPDRIDAGVAALDLVAASSLQFEAPDNEAFPALGLAFDAARQGVAATTVLNAANEVAVSAFLQGQIGFLRIADVIEGTLQHDVGAAGGDLAERLELDARARRMAADLVRKWPTEREGAVR
ncbi:MAG: 1-deoxy-D-xylulose-5-phosphate reductoisomerase [Xanthomonadales bacterium]|nr:1-deoxy-D-xylulose-5-phosphate reductoisomerase [Xanthomonadales bacterium]